MEDRDLDAAIARLMVMNELHDQREKEFREEITDLRKDINSVQNAMGRWHGAFAAVVGFGMFIGWAVAQLGSFLKIGGR